MPHNRYYHPGPFQGTITLTGDEHQHLFKVMRGMPGHTVELIDGRGHLATATIEAIDRKTTHLKIDHCDFTPPAAPRLLCQSLIKQPKLELVVEKCTELGITDFHFFPADKSERDHISDNHLQRLHHIALAATKQCGRLYVPTVHLHSKLYIPADAVFATLRGNPAPITSASAALIGPESGWSQKEEKMLLQHARPVSLHANTLRAETAAIVASLFIR